MAGRSVAIRLILAASLLCLAVAGRARAQPAAPTLSEGDFLSDIPLIFSASRMAQTPADAIGSVTVIDHEMIAASGARSLAELFRLVPGFQVASPRGGRPVVAYHGLAGEVSQRMQVLVDGRSLYAPYKFGGVDWAGLTVSVDDIERIEVLRGSNSAAYGANAFLGVANIITRAAAQSIGAHISVTRGSNGIGDAVGRIGAGFGPGQVRLSFGEQRDEGLGSSFDTGPKARGIRLYDRRYSRFADVRSEFQISAQDEVALFGGISTGRYGIGFENTPESIQLGLENSPGDPRRTESTQSAYGMVRWHRTLAPDNEFTVSYSRTEDEGADKFVLPLGSNRSLTVDYGRRATRDSLEYQHNMAWGEQWRGVWGLEMRRDSIRAPQLFNTQAGQKSESTRAFASAEWRPDRQLTFNAGGLIERDSIAGTQFAPRLGMNWKPTPLQTFKVGYSKAFRTPSLFEQRSDWRFVFEGRTLDIRYLSRGNLKPELVRSFEVGYLGQLPDGRLALDARIFDERISRLITQQLYAVPPDQELKPDGAYDLRNADEARIRGIDYQIKWKPTRASTLLFNHYLASRTGSQPYITESIPSRSYSILGSYALTPALQASVLYSSVAPMRWLAEPVGVPAQRDLILRLAYGFELGGGRANLSLVHKSSRADSEFRPLQFIPRQTWLRFSLDY